MMKKVVFKELKEVIYPSLNERISNIIFKVDKSILQDIEEIRLRVNRPLIISNYKRDYFISQHGKCLEDSSNAYLVTFSDIQHTLQLLSQYSLYAFEEELKSGFITLKGGHRVGICGKAVIIDGEIKTLKYVNGLNYRIMRQVIGAADSVMRFVRDANGKVYHTLIVSPPQCGKTTMLRDIIRQLSNGDSQKGIKGLKVGVVDERSELAGCYRGIPQNNIGIRTDVLDNCPKAQGIVNLIRSMSPEIIATDEIGSNKDIDALHQALNAGIKVITTVHGSSIEEIKQKPNLKRLLENHLFERIIFLHNLGGVGTIKQIYDGNSLKVIG